MWLRTFTVYDARTKETTFRHDLVVKARRADALKCPVNLPARWFVTETRLRAIDKADYGTLRHCVSTVQNLEHDLNRAHKVLQATIDRILGE